MPQGPLPPLGSCPCQSFRARFLLSIHTMMSLERSDASFFSYPAAPPIRAADLCESCRAWISVLKQLNVARPGARPAQALVRHLAEPPRPIPALARVCRGRRRRGLFAAWPRGRMGPASAAESGPWVATSPSGDLTRASLPPRRERGNRDSRPRVRRTSLTAAAGSRCRPNLPPARGAGAGAEATSCPTTTTLLPMAPCRISAVPLIIFRPRRCCPLWPEASTSTSSFPLR